MVHPALPKVTAYLEELSNASLDYFPGSILQGIQAIHVGKGIIECKLIIEDRVLGEDGTIHTGAIAAIMENIGATAIFSAGGSDHASVDFNYSLYSTAKKQDEVKIEARVIGRKDDLTSAVIEIRRECDEELIATGRLWMVQRRSLNVKHNGVDLPSKL
ncbi:hypothetical protein HID58_028428 [Brassica napus]|uniref:Thioesterase domain-containing protein n=2 Tax=Brassica TaxID=3705 RepID=A0ABQ8CA78_BRANA|nr:uncharacterized protein LOC106360471 [Brassica napus]KAH0913982.1 hypothetical protein HID58_028428 [Brassica napus]CAG7896574.1 unnamed protein product [Brassica rapa]VDD02796.1 unnamed protein product [Brassica rapa]